MVNEMKTEKLKNILRVSGLNFTGKKKNLSQESLWQRTNNIPALAIAERVEK